MTPKQSDAMIWMSIPVIRLDVSGSLKKHRAVLPSLDDPEVSRQNVPDKMSRTKYPGQNIPEQNVLGQNILGQNVPGQNIPGQNVPGQNILGQNVPGQNIPEQNILGQNIFEQNIPGQNILAEIDFCCGLRAYDIFRL